MSASLIKPALRNDCFAMMLAVRFWPGTEISAADLLAE